jgi:cholesterol transport system auxiliary component
MRSIPHLQLSRRLLLQSAGALSLAGCGGNLIGPPPAPQMYALRPDFAPVSNAPTVSWQLVVTVPAAPESLDTERIALERAPNILDYYAKAQWTDRLPVLVQSLLVEAFEKSGRIAAVARESAGLRADLVLETEIRHFEAYYAVLDTPPKVQVGLLARLLGAIDREVKATAEFHKEVQAANNDLPNITAAFGQAAGSTISAIVPWALQAHVAPASR